MMSFPLIFGMPPPPGAVPLPMMFGGDASMLNLSGLQPGTSGRGPKRARESMFTYNDVVAFEEDDRVRLAHLVRPVNAQFSMPGVDCLKGPLLQGEMIIGDETVDLDESQLLLIERGLRLGDIVKKHPKCGLESRIQSVLSTEKAALMGKEVDLDPKSSNARNSLIGQVIDRKIVADVRKVRSNMVIRNLPVDKAVTVDEVNYEWNKKVPVPAAGCSSTMAAYPTGYGREANFYELDNWIGEVISQNNTVTLVYSGYEFTIILGTVHGISCCWYERCDGADNRKKTLVPRDKIRISFYDVVSKATWPHGLPSELNVRKKPAHRKRDLIECDVKKVELFSVLMSWLRPNVMDPVEAEKMSRNPPSDIVLADDLKRATLLDRRRWPHSGERILLGTNEHSTPMTLEQYEGEIHNEFSIELGLQPCCFDRSSSPLPPVHPDDVVEILLTRTVVTVQWSDGVIEEGIPSAKLVTCNDLIEALPRGHAPEDIPYLPSQVVRKKSVQDDCCVHQRKDGVYGIVMSYNEADRLATVKWMTVTNGEVDPSVEPVTSVDSFYDLEPLYKQIGDFSRCGDLSIFSGRKAQNISDITFRVGRMLEDGRIEAHFWNGHTEPVWPFFITSLMSGVEFIMCGPDGELIEGSKYQPTPLPVPGHDAPSATLALAPDEGEVPFGAGMGAPGGEGGEFGGYVNSMLQAHSPEDMYDLMMSDMAILAGFARRALPADSGLRWFATHAFDRWKVAADSHQTDFFDLADKVAQLVASGIVKNNDYSPENLKETRKKMLLNVAEGETPDLGTIHLIDQVINFWKYSSHSTQDAFRAALPLPSHMVDQEGGVSNNMAAPPVGNFLFPSVPPSSQEAERMEEGGDGEEVLVEPASFNKFKAHAPRAEGTPESGITDSCSMSEEGAAWSDSPAPRSPKSVTPPLMKSPSFKIDKTCTSHAFLADPQVPPQPSFIRVIGKEIKMLGDLPPGIHVTFFEDRMDLLSVLIMGPKDTPFEDTPFHFDMKLPIDYPASPPLCFFTALSKTALNPNLYQNGKVCLSLLGTWSAANECEHWNPRVSSIAQVLLSIQGLILTAEPYWNEPGYEARKADSDEQSASQRYNEQVLLSSAEYFERIVEKPPKAFAELIRDHATTVVPKLHARLSHIMSGTFQSPYPLPKATKGFELTMKRHLDGIERKLKISSSEGADQGDSPAQVTV